MADTVLINTQGQLSGFKINLSLGELIVQELLKQV